MHSKSSVKRWGGEVGGGQPGVQVRRAPRHERGLEGSLSRVRGDLGSRRHRMEREGARREDDCPQPHAATAHDETPV